MKPKVSHVEGFVGSGESRCVITIVSEINQGNLGKVTVTLISD